MIKPSEVPQPKEDPRHDAERATIEKYFDDALSHGTTRIGLPRSGWLMSNVSAVLDKYRANGWKVTDTGAAYVFEAAT